MIFAPTQNISGNATGEDLPTITGLAAGRTFYETDKDNLGAFKFLGVLTDMDTKDEIKASVATTYYGAHYSICTLLSTIVTNSEIGIYCYSIGAF